MPRMTLSQIRAHHRRLPRFRRLAFENLHDRITLDAALAGLMSEELTLTDEPAAEICIATDESPGERLEVAEDELLVQGEPAEWSEIACIYTLEDNSDPALEELWIDAYDDSGEAYEEYYWEEFAAEDYGESIDSELVDPIYYEEGYYEETFYDDSGYVGGEYVGSDEDLMMYSFMTGVGEEDLGALPEELESSEEVSAGESEEVSAGEKETLSEEEFVIDDELIKTTQFEDFVVGEAGEFLPLSAVERTLSGGDTSEVVAEAAGEVEHLEIPDVAETLEVAEPVALAETPELIEFTVVMDSVSEAEAPAVVAFTTPAVEILSADPLALPLFSVPASIEQPSIAVAEMTPAAAPLTQTQEIATEQTDAVSLIAFDDSSPPVTAASETASDESLLSRSNAQLPGLTSIALIVADDEETDDEAPTAAAEDAPDEEGPLTGAAESSDLAAL